MKAAALAYITIVLAAVAGWVMNLVEVIHQVAANAPFGTLLVARVIGIPVGILGAVLGWC